MKRLAGRLPTVRYGSTETTLQVCGIPVTLPPSVVLSALQAGRDRSGSSLSGYYIGREHPPHTCVMIVQAVDEDTPLQVLMSIA